MNILVTKGAGYSGSHTVRKLKLANHEVVIFDNLSSGHKYAINGFALFICDLPITSNNLSVCQSIDDSNVKKTCRNRIAENLAATQQ